MIASKKSHQNLSDYKVFIQKRFDVNNKKQIFSLEKIRNSVNCIYDYAHSFFGENFQSNALYWLKKFDIFAVRINFMLARFGQFLEIE